jgi:hypothetical protein
MISQEAYDRALKDKRYLPMEVLDLPLSESAHALGKAFLDARDRYCAPLAFDASYRVELIEAIRFANSLGFKDLPKYISQPLIKGSSSKLAGELVKFRLEKGI